MSKHETFRFKSSDDLLRKAEQLGLDMPFQQSINPLFERVKIGTKTVPNRFAVQPMEGFDGNSDGSPDELTYRRYGRYASGGSGLIWFEATSVVQEGRSNPRQLMLNRGTLDGFKSLVDHTRRSGYRQFGNSHDLFLVLQITHSGRYSKPEGKALGKAACGNPYLDKPGESASLFSDRELDDLLSITENAVRLTHEAGFDAVDIKACHGYLIHELLGAHTRDDSKYGGAFENRIRFLLEAVRQAHRSYPELIAVRLNATDGIPHPYGFGMASDGSPNVDLSEPKLLIKRLAQAGCSLLNITTGIPYYNPHLVRPFNRPVTGAPVPPEHPLEGVVRMINIAAELQKKAPSIPFVGTGYSWLRHFFPHVGSAVVSRNDAAFIGLGRSSFAYPDAPKDLMKTGKMDPRKCCVSCSLCTELMRYNHRTGCVIRDREIYSSEYKQLRAELEGTVK